MAGGGAGGGGGFSIKGGEGGGGGESSWVGKDHWLYLRDHIQPPERYWEIMLSAGIYFCAVYSSVLCYAHIHSPETKLGKVQYNS